ncbi:hypothetical protein ACLMAJ_15905 [Nocardia sp. KC 131]|uniref:hypothetical protein n=1 Tax=Nocardia arseniciresistens TaxID=3392119 RepID=UPI00398EFAB5
MIALIGAGCADNHPSQAAASASETGAAATPDQQDDGHRRLNQLVGEWSGAKSTFVAGGTANNPVKHDIVSRWHWITETGSNFLQEEAESNVGSEPYYRLGLLGYSPPTIVMSGRPLTASRP